MLRWLILFWVCLEVTGFVWVGKWLGLGWTLVLIMASIGVGIALLREQGFRAANIMMQKMRTGESASPENFMEMPFVTLGSILLIIPGFFSDIMGLLCLLPPVQRAAIKWLSRVMRQQKCNSRVNVRHRMYQGQTFEGEYKQQQKTKL